MKSNKITQVQNEALERQIDQLISQIKTSKEDELKTIQQKHEISKIVIRGLGINCFRKRQQNNQGTQNEAFRGEKSK